MLHSDLVSIISYAVKAPSGHNTQPWKFIISKNQIQIHPDFSRALLLSDPDHHILYIGLGCALENLIIAAKEFGYKSRVVLSKNDIAKFILKIYLQKCDYIQKDELFQWIEKRQTNRRLYSSRKIPTSHLEQLKRSAAMKGVRTVLVEDKGDQQKLEPFIIEGTRRQLQNQEQMQEVLPWLRFSKEEARRKGDGLWLATFGLPTLPSKVAALFLKYFSTEKSEVKKVKKAVRCSSALGMFLIKKYDVTHWINLGRSFQRFALKATELGIAHAHLHAPCEDPEIKQSMIHSINQEGHLQLILRLGYAKPMPYSFRRSIEEVLVDQSLMNETYIIPKFVNHFQ